MVLPITGPVVTTQGQSVDAAWSWRDYKVKYSQEKPVTFPLPYKRNVIRVTSAKCSGYPTANLGGMGNAYGKFSPWQQRVNYDFWEVPDRPYGTYDEQALNMARDRFMDKLGESAQIAVNLAERQQAIDMITRRGGQILASLRSVRRGQFKRAARHLEIDPALVEKRGKKRETKDWASRWLELHLGWSPMIGDIYASVDLLQGPIPVGNFRVKGPQVRFRYPFEDHSHGPTWRDDWYGETRGFVSAAVAGKVSIDNPNLWLANRLGLLNPAGVAWELVTLSFVADWFVNVGQFLESWTDLAGLTITDGWWHKRSKVWAWGSYSSTSTLQTPNTWLERYVTSEGSFFERGTGFPGVTLGFRPPKNLSVSRALTAISLLVQKGFK